jgi:hypothetical protein
LYSTLVHMYERVYLVGFVYINTAVLTQRVLNCAIKIVPAYVHTYIHTYIYNMLRKVTYMHAYITLQHHEAKYYTVKSKCICSTISIIYYI